MKSLFRQIWSIILCKFGRHSWTEYGQCDSCKVYRKAKEIGPKIPIVVELFDADDQRACAVGGAEWKCVHCGHLTTLHGIRVGSPCTAMTQHNFQRC